jgi:hypothetical protein
LATNGTEDEIKRVKSVKIDVIILNCCVGPGMSSGMFLGLCASYYILLYRCSMRNISGEIKTWLMIAIIDTR